MLSSGRWILTCGYLDQLQDEKKIGEKQTQKWQEKIYKCSCGTGVLQ
jgi:hypothetical protein